MGYFSNYFPHNNAKDVIHNLRIRFLDKRREIARSRKSRGRTILVHKSQNGLKGISGKINSQNKTESNLRSKDI